MMKKISLGMWINRIEALLEHCRLILNDPAPVDDGGSSEDCCWLAERVIETLEGARGEAVSRADPTDQQTANSMSMKIRSTPAQDEKHSQEPNWVSHNGPGIILWTLDPSLALEMSQAEGDKLLLYLGDGYEAVRR